MLLGLPLYGYVSQSTATTLTGIAMPPAGFQLDEYKERVLNLPRRNRFAACPMPTKGEGEPTFLDGKHERTNIGPEVKVEAAAGDLSSYFGQQIPFNQITALGALKKSGSVYVQANGYTEGEYLNYLSPPPRLTGYLGWDDCSDTPVRIHIIY